MDMNDAICICSVWSGKDQAGMPPDDYLLLNTAEKLVIDHAKEAKERFFADKQRTFT